MPNTAKPLTTSATAPAAVSPSVPARKPNKLPAPAAPKKTKPVAKTSAAALEAKAPTKAVAKVVTKSVTKSVTKVAAKATKPAKPAKRAVASTADVPALTKPAKLVRDSFTMPAQEYAAIATLKARTLIAGRESKKSELLRFGLVLLMSMEPAALVAGLNGLAVLKVGRRKGK